MGIKTHLRIPDGTRNGGQTTERIISVKVGHTDCILEKDWVQSINILNSLEEITICLTLSDSDITDHTS